MFPPARRGGTEDGPRQLRTAGTDEAEEAHDLAAGNAQVDLDEARPT